MKHIKPISLILESRAPRQLYTLYYVSDREIKGRSQLPRMDYRTGVLIPTYYLIQDAVRASEPGDHIYQCVVKAALGTELQLETWLLERGYDPEEYFESLESEHKLPNGMDPEEFSDFRWGFDGIEIGEIVLVWELSYLTDSMSEVSAHQIERVRRKGVNEDLIPGGKADNLTPEDLAQKHGVSVDSIMKEIAIGIQVELEHVDDEKQAREIAMDHIEEDPRYYQRLIQSGIADEAKAIALYHRYYGK